MWMHHFTSNDLLFRSKNMVQVWTCNLICSHLRQDDADTQDLNQNMWIIFTNDEICICHETECKHAAELDLRFIHEVSYTQCERGAEAEVALLSMSDTTVLQQIHAFK